MSRILVSLVSQQAAPNLLLMLDPAFADIKQHLLITTPEMNAQGQVQRLLAATRLREDQVQTITVPADDPQPIHQALQGHCPAGGRTYLVNLTGGTKVMSLAVSNYFSQPSFQAEMFYVSLGKNTVRRIYPLDDAEQLPLQYRFDLGTYLTGYGIREQPQMYPYQADAAVEQRLLHDHLRATQPLEALDKPIWWFAAYLANYCRKDLKSDQLPLATFAWLPSWLAYLNYTPLTPEVLTQDELRYLNSAWLEHYVRREICRLLRLPEAATAVGTKLYREGADWKYRNNEFDVLFLYRNRLHLVECKTAMRRNRRETKRLFHSTLHKLAALKREFGLNVRISLVTLSDQLRETKKGRRQPIPDYQLRADLFDIPIIDQDSLAQGAEAWLPHLLEGRGMTASTS